MAKHLKHKQTQGWYAAKKCSYVCICEGIPPLFNKIRMKTDRIFWANNVGGGTVKYIEYEDGFLE